MSEALLRLAGVLNGIPGCTACPLHESATAPVPGNIKQGCGVVLVGEAPGRDEDREGKPFAGAAGRLLNEALRRSGLAGRVSVMTTICCRPPGDSYNEAVRVAGPNVCDHWYRMQLSASGAWIVVPLGDRALSKWGSDRRVTQARGKPFWSGRHLVVPSWDLSYALRNKTAKGELIADLTVVKKIVESEASLPTPKNYDPTLALNALRAPPAYTDDERRRFTAHWKKHGWVAAYSHWLEDHVVAVRDERVVVPDQVDGVRYKLRELVRMSHMDRDWETARRIHHAKKTFDAELI